MLCLSILSGPSPHRGRYLLAFLTRMPKPRSRCIETMAASRRLRRSKSRIQHLFSVVCRSRTRPKVVTTPILRTTQECLHVGTSAEELVRFYVSIYPQRAETSDRVSKNREKLIRIMVHLFLDPRMEYLTRDRTRAVDFSRRPPFNFAGLPTTSMINRKYLALLCLCHVWSEQTSTWF